MMASRGLANPEERALLSDRLHDADEALVTAAGRLRDALGTQIEGRDTNSAAGPNYNVARREFEEACDAVIDFLNRADVEAERRTT